MYYFKIQTCWMRANNCSKTRGVTPRSSVTNNSELESGIDPHIVCVLPLPVYIAQEKNSMSDVIQQNH